MKTGRLVISLDFEGLWGSICSNDVSSFVNRVGQIKTYPYILLEVFKEYDIHATWATVGALLCESPDEMLSYLKNDIFYSNWNLSMRNYVSRISASNRYMYFEPEIVKEISKTKYQEIGCHTFSHFYTREPGATLDLFRQEIESCVQIMNKNGIELRTLVLPRNMIEKDYINIAYENGIDIFRGRQNKFISFTRGDRNKVIDFADNFIRIRRDLSYPHKDIQKENGIYNIKASMFLRTYNAQLSALEEAKLMRIKTEMTYAAEEKKIFHLWWHPHNMATDIKKNCKMLREIFNHYRCLNEKYGYQSLNMTEIAEEINDFD